MVSGHCSIELPLSLVLHTYDDGEAIRVEALETALKYRMFHVGGYAKCLFSRYFLLWNRFLRCLCSFLSPTGVMQYEIPNFSIDKVTRTSNANRIDAKLKLRMA